MFLKCAERPFGSFAIIESLCRTQKTIAANEDVVMVSDFVQSNLLVSRVVAMVSENRSVNSVLAELLGGQPCSFLC